jgi:hypothetical protein
LEEVKALYEIASHLIPAYDRSKHETRRELMHSFGVKQQGMGENQSPVLLKMNASPRYQEFQRRATLYYGKQEILERLIAPKNHACRKEMKDEVLEGAPRRRIGISPHQSRVKWSAVKLSRYRTFAGDAGMDEKKFLSTRRPVHQSKRLALSFLLHF